MGVRRPRQAAKAPTKTPANAERFLEVLTAIVGDTATPPANRRASQLHSPEQEQSLLKRKRVTPRSDPSSSTVARPLLLLPHEATNSESLSLSKLNGELIAQSLSFLDITTKVSAVRATSRTVCETLQYSTAWNPLYMNEASTRLLLITLKARDPLGCFRTDALRVQHALPGGLFRVDYMDIVLMPPDVTDTDTSEAETNAVRTEENSDSLPAPLLSIADPLNELCRRLRHYFPLLSTLRLTGIWAPHADRCFAGLRSSHLAAFNFIELVCCSTAPVMYTLTARRDVPAGTVCTSAAKVENRSRVPPGVHLDPTTSLSDHEALYLMEHKCAFKNGDAFYVMHTPSRTVRARIVHQHYTHVLELLRRRSPEKYLVN